MRVLVTGGAGLIGGLPQGFGRSSSPVAMALNSTINRFSWLF